MDLRSCISVFSICIFISGFGYSSGQNTTDEGNVTMTSSTPEPVTASNSTTGQNVTAADEENVNITSSAPEPVTASNSTTESSPSTESANSSAVGNITDSAVTEEINQQPNPKVTDRTVPPPLERDLLIIILSLTTAAGFLLWILTLIIVCSVCCYKHCTVCSSDKNTPPSDAPHVAPPSTPAPRPDVEKDDEDYKDLYAQPQKKRPQKQPPDDIYGFDLPPRGPNSEACVSEADTDGVSDSNSVFCEEENKQKPATSGNPNKSTEPNDSATTSEKSPALNYTNGLTAGKALALHNNPLFIKQEEAINKDRDARVFEEDKVYSEVEVD